MRRQRRGPWVAGPCRHPERGEDLEDTEPVPAARGILGLSWDAGIYSPFSGPRPAYNSPCIVTTTTSERAGEQRAFLQQRVAFFGKVLSFINLLGLGVYVALFPREPASGGETMAKSFGRSIERASGRRIR